MQHLEKYISLDKLTSVYAEILTKNNFNKKTELFQFGFFISSH